MNRRIALSSFFGGMLAAADLKIIKSNGGSVQVKLTQGEIWNRESSLSRIFYTINDNSCPIQLGEAGAKMAYTKQAVDEFVYTAEVPITAYADVLALEIILVLFDVWGDRVTALGLSKLATIGNAGVATARGGWRAIESEAKSYRTCACYVSRVMAGDETKWKCDEQAILRTLTGIKLNIQIEGLKPEPPKGKLV